MLLCVQGMFCFIFRRNSVPVLLSSLSLEIVSALQGLFEHIPGAARWYLRLIDEDEAMLTKLALGVFGIIYKSDIKGSSRPCISSVCRWSATKESSSARNGQESAISCGSVNTRHQNASPYHLPRRWAWVVARVGLFWVV